MNADAAEKLARLLIDEHGLAEWTFKFNESWSHAELQGQAASD